MGRERAEQEAINYQQVVAYLAQVNPSPGWTLTEEIVKEIHRISFTNINDPLVIPGEYKSVPNHILTAAGEVVHYPTPPHLVRSFMAGLVFQINAWMELWDTSRPTLRLHPIAIAAYACHGINHIHPFADGNGRTSRAVATLVLMRYGYNCIRTGDQMRPLMSLEWFFDQYRGEYSEAMTMADKGQLDRAVAIFSQAVEETMVKINLVKFATMQALIQEQTGLVAQAPESPQEERASD